MARKVLTDVGIRHLRAGSTRREVPDPGQRGLYVQVQPSGRKGFAVRFRSSGKPAKYTLPAGLTLAQARKLASEVMFSVAQGVDPRTTKKHAKQKAAAAAKDTVCAVCEEFLARPEHRQLRSLDAYGKTLRRLVFPTLGDRQIDSIKRSEIVRLLDKVADERGAPMADYVLRVVGRVMNWHASRSDEFRSPIVRGMARTKPKERARSRILSDDELRRVWLAADNAPGPFPALVKFLLLTAARRTEAAGMARGEVESGADWVLPAARNKTKQELVRPLSQTAQELLAAQPKFAGGPYVFSVDGRRPISSFSKSKREFDAACGVTGWTLHDCRRTARSLLSRAGINSDHAEQCLGHVIPGVRGVYDRYAYRNEMQHAFEALASLITSIVYPQDNVRQLRS
jgi:integrase